LSTSLGCKLLRADTCNTKPQPVSAGIGHLWLLAECRLKQVDKALPLLYYKYT